jgi:hypothetical protein
MHEVRKLSVGVYFVSEVQIAQPPTTIGGQIVTETNVALFVSVMNVKLVLILYVITFKFVYFISG